MPTLELTGPGLTLTFQHENKRLALLQMQRVDGKPLLYTDGAATMPGHGSHGNPLALVIRDGEHAGVYGMETFRVTNLTHDERSLLAYMAHDSLPVVFALAVEVEGHVARWRGQIGWNGATSVELETYFPLWSRLVFDNSQTDRTIFPSVSGSTQGPTGGIEYANTYLGSLSAPLFLIEGGNRGLAVLDENRADFAAEPGATCKRTYFVGNTLPRAYDEHGKIESVGSDGPLVGVCHTRVFRSVGDVGLTDADMKAELRGDLTLPMECRGDLVDLGPIRAYAYIGDWRQGALWLREQRRGVPFRQSPAAWYHRTTFISEHMGDEMVRQGQSFYDYPRVLAEKETLGSNLFHLPGFHDAEILGNARNWQNRGDYFFAADNLGGFDAVQRGVEAIHRRGGRVLYYVEGLIMWKRSRIGRSKGRDWALMKADDTYDEHYKGFWHMCPSVAEWRDWLAQTCADVVRTTGVDGFFIDSSCATHFHRCFNPAHQHPHPDTWNWGLRQLLKRVREEVDKVNPETILFVEGAGDMAREFGDGFVTHSHDWTRRTFTVPLVRFIYPQMRAFESWGGGTGADVPDAQTNEALHVWNAVTGHRIYAHGPNAERMAPYGRHVRDVYDLYPEICDSELSGSELETTGCMAELFDGPPCVLTVGNLSAQTTTATVRLPVPAGVLFDRVNGERIGVVSGTVTLPLPAYSFRAFEVRV